MIINENRSVMMKKLTYASVLALSLFLVGCADKEEEVVKTKAETEEVANKEESEGSNKEETAKADEKEFNDGVDQVRFEEVLATFPETVPTKFVTTSVPVTEMMQLLGLEPVGVPTSTNPIPAEFDSITRIGSPMAPDLEVISNVQTELIIGAASLQSSLDKAIEGVNLKAAYLPTESYDDLKLSFKVLGTYFGKEKEAEEVLKKLVAKEEELKKAAEGKDLPSVMLVIGTSDSFMVMSEKSYLGSLVNRLGADNIASSVLKVDAVYSPINLEEVVVADPDIIFVLASGDHGANEEKFKKEVEANSAWTQLSAYKNNKIHHVDYSVFGVTSIKNAETALTTISDYFFE